MCQSSQVKFWLGLDLQGLKSAGVWKGDDVDAVDDDYISDYIYTYLSAAARHFSAMVLYLVR